MVGSGVGFLATGVPVVMSFWCYASKVVEKLLFVRLAREWLIWLLEMESKSSSYCDSVLLPDCID